MHGGGGEGGGSYTCTVHQASECVGPGAQVGYYLSVELEIS